MAGNTSATRLSPRLALAATTFLALWAAACGGTPQSQPAHANVRADTPSRATSAQPLWTFTVPARAGVSQVLDAGNNVLVTVPALTILDRSSGKVVARHAGLREPVAILSATAVVAADPQGGIARLGLPGGNVQWHIKPICNVPGSAHFPPVTLLSASGNAIYAGCIGGRMVRVDARNGAVLATRAIAPVERFTAAEQLPRGFLSVAGFSSGAVSTQWTTLIRGSDLRPVFGAKQDTQFLGTVGTTAVLDDLCCFGRADVYRPATIVRVNLATAAVAASLDLRPDAAAHPPKSIGLGLGWSAAKVTGGRLLLGIVPTLFDYGDPRGAVTAPKRLVKGLADPPRFLAGGAAFLTLRSANGGLTGKLVDVASDPIRTVRTFPLAYPPVIGQRPESADAFSLWTSVGGATGPAFVRSRDGATIVAPRGCELVASSRTRAYAVCFTRTVDSARQYVAAFAFPESVSASR